MEIYTFEFWEEDHWEHIASFVGAPSKQQVEVCLFAVGESITDKQHNDLVSGKEITTIDSHDGYVRSYRMVVMGTLKGEA